MKIKTRLLISALLPVCLGMIVGLVLLGTGYREDLVRKRAHAANNIAQGVFEWNALCYDYLLHPGARAIAQWNIKYRSISDLLDQLEGTSGEQAVILNRLRDNLVDIKSFFERVVASGSSQSNAGEAVQRLRERSVGQLLVKSGAMVTDARRVADLSDAAAVRMRQWTDRSVVGLLTVFAFISGVIALLISRSILNPITELQHGAGKIAQGDLAHRLAVTRRDEVGELAGAFNAMTEKLQGSYGSLNAEIAQRKQAEVSLRDLNKTLEQRVNARTEELAERNRELDAFSYVASHDLKAPLRAIDNLASWIAQDVGDDLPDDSKRHLEQLQQRAQRMKNLLDDLLQYSRAGRFEYEPEQIDARSLLGEVVGLLAPPNGFRVEILGEMPVFETAKAPLFQVFQNLIGNAIKYHDQKDGEVIVGTEKNGAFYKFWVADDGPGIAPDFHEKVFQMFQKLQSRDDVEGTGIGLAVVKKTVESYGGKITLESAEGEGARFEFTWPQTIEGAL